MHEDLEAFADVFEAFLRGHVYIRDDKAYKVLTVWVICSYYMDSWNYFPHIYIGSPMHGSGKSTLAKAMLCGTANPKKEKKLTFPSLVSIIREAKIKPTIFLDEVHQYFGPQAPQDWEQFFLDSFEYDATIKKQGPTDKGRWETIETDAFVPTVIAMNPYATIPSAVVSRCIKVDMWADENKRPKLNERKAKEDLKPFIEKLKATPGNSFENYTDIADIGLTNRDEDKWLPFVAVADCFREEWSKAIRDTALEWSQKESPQDDMHNMTLVLLEGVGKSFKEKGLKLTTDEVKSSTNSHLKNEGIPVLEHYEFIRMVKSFEIKAKQIHRPDGPDDPKPNKYGYSYDQFIKAWKAYTPHVLEWFQEDKENVVELDVSKNEHDDSMTHMNEALAFARKSLRSKGL
jgi:hypothetical protein